MSSLNSMSPEHLAQSLLHTTWTFVGKKSGMEAVGRCCGYLKILGYDATEQL